MNNPEYKSSLPPHPQFLAFSLIIAIAKCLLLQTAQTTISGFNNSVKAQIIPDNTLGTENSVVTPDGIESEKISGGAVRGSNVFHSFQEFNVGEGRGAYFDNPEAQNIFSRVTGSNPSNILGTLGVVGNANLFFMNPNGIIFGENSSLDIRGSFLATTADSILFPDGDKFSALNPEAAPLLTVNVQQPVGLEFAGGNGNITNRSFVKNSAGEFVGLEISSGNNLALVGGNIDFEAGEATAKGGNIYLGGLAEAGIVNLNENGSLSFPEGITLANVSLLNFADVDVRGEGGGNITVDARNLTLDAGEFGFSLIRGGISSESNDPEAQAGDVIINVTDNIHLKNGRVENSINSGGVGNSGEINITTYELSLSNGGTITSSVFGEGKSGKININAADKIIVESRGSISSSIARGAVGNSEGINIATTNLSLTDGGRIDSSPKGTGNTGKIIINASGDISIVGNNQTRLKSGIFNRIDANATGNSGGIEITAKNLDLLEGGVIDTAIAKGGEGEGGDIFIEASDSILIDGELRGFDSNGKPIVFNPSGIYTSIDPGDQEAPRGKGKAGEINIITTQLSLSNKGTITSSVFGEGKSGKININAADNILIENGGSIFSSIATGAVGDSEGIDIITDKLSLSNGGTINTSTSGKGNAGRININAADNILIELGGGIFSSIATGAVGDSGGIEITTKDLYLTEGTRINAGTFGQGNAGKIIINASGNVSIEGGGISSTVDERAIGNSGGIEITSTNLSLKTWQFLNEGGQISTSTNGTGNAGKIIINASGDVSVEGKLENRFNSGIFSTVGEKAVGNSEGIEINSRNISLTEGSRISADTFGQGDAGDIDIKTTDLFLSEGSEISANIYGTGDGGNINIETVNLTAIHGTEISTAIDGQGDGGKITINASDTISAQEGEFFNLVTVDGKGDSGGIEITTKDLYLTEGTRINAGTFGQGNAGKIIISASGNVSIEGGGISSTVDERAIGNSGGIEITSTNLSLETWQFLNEGGQISTSTNGTGNAGKIIINTSGDVSVEGKLENRFNSGIFSTVGEKAVGNSEGIEINSRNISLTEGSKISADTDGQGDAGDIDITSSTLTATNGSQIQTNTTTDFDAANIMLKISDNLLLSDTETGLFAQTEGAGTAGDITIDTPKLAIDQDAIISAFTTDIGNSGTITINAPQEIVINNGSKLTVETSDAGKPGNIFITTPSLTIGKNAQLSATATQKSTNTEGGGLITIYTSSLDLTGKLGIFAETKGVSPAGTLKIQPYTEQTDLNIKFTDTAILSTQTTASGVGGDIKLTALETINISGKGKITAETSGSGNAGNINIETKDLNISNQTEISALTSGTGSAGDINLEATENLSLNNSNISSAVATDAVGNAGNVQLTAPSIIISDNSIVSTATDGEGKAGTVTVKATNLETNNGSQLRTSTATSFEAGSIILEVSENMNLAGNNSGIFANTEKNSTGRGGSILTQSFTPNRIIVEQDAAIAVNSEGEGEAGSINLQTEELTLDNGAINLSTDDSGDAGDLTITTPNLTLSNGGNITAKTSGEGKAGDIFLEVSENMNLAGNNSGIFANTAENSTGRGGSIRTQSFTPKRIIVEQGAAIAVNSAGEGTGGGINLIADELLLNKGSVTAATASNQGGNVALNLSEPLRLRNQSKITATAGTNQGTGDGGNIIINSPFIISSLNEDNDITANASFGNGGRVEITSQGIFGIEFRNRTTDLSDITASSEFGQQGIVEINTSAVDPTRSLNSLPQQATETKVAQSCQENNSTITLEFFDIGRGGLPPTPDDLFTSDAIIAEWIPLNLETEIELSSNNSEYEINSMAFVKSFSCQ